jgi:hypothetical protein
MITARPYHNFFSLGFFGFSALRFMVAVIATLSFVPASGLSPFSEIHVRLVGAGEPDPGSQLFVTNEPHAIFLFLKHERSELPGRALEARTGSTCANEFLLGRNRQWMGDKRTRAIRILPRTARCRI